MNLQVGISIAIASISLFLVEPRANAIPAPADARARELISIDHSKAQPLPEISRLRTGLVVSIEEILKNSALSEREVLVAIYRMLRRVGLAFNGAFALPPNMTYFDSLGEISLWIARDSDRHQVVPELQTRLLNAINQTGKSDPLLASFGYIIAAGISPNDTTTALTQLLTIPSTIQSAGAPIVLHNVFLAAMILSAKDKDTKELSQAIAATLPHLNGEEQREDALAALALMGDDSARAAVFDFIENPKSPSSDLDLETAILACRFRMKQEVFNDFYGELLEKQANPERKEFFRQFRERAFQYGLISQSGAIKVWDEFSLTMYDDGMLISNQELSDFRAK